jgi:DNA-binding helix-hairpin-helix protein with protein kinase domain
MSLGNLRSVWLTGGGEAKEFAVSQFSRHGAGGQATVYGSNLTWGSSSVSGGGEPVLLKIYKPSLLKKKRADLENRIRHQVRMFGNLSVQMGDSGPLLVRRISWPRNLVYADHTCTKFIGCAFEGFHGKPWFKLSSDPEGAFPGRQRDWIVNVCRRLLRLLVYLHNAGIIVGDLNDQNVLVDDAGEVYVIDADNFQFQYGSLRFPVTYMHGDWCAPEFQGKNPSSVVWTAKADLFAYAINAYMALMFMHPFQCINGFTREDNLRNGRFPLGQSGVLAGQDGTLPDAKIFLGYWKPIAYELKARFIQTFREYLNQPERRPDHHMWRSALEAYKKRLEPGGAIYPWGLKIRTFLTYGKLEEYGLDSGRPR